LSHPHWPLLENRLHTYASGRLPGRRDQPIPSIRERSERAFRKSTFPQCELCPVVNGSTSPCSGNARMHTCLDQYNTNKTGTGNGGLKWIQKGGGYYSECNKRLKG
jgi:hypothetical protein